MKLLANNPDMADILENRCRAFIAARQADDGGVSADTESAARNLLTELKLAYDISPCRRCGRDVMKVGTTYCDECQAARPFCRCGQAKLGWDVKEGDWFLDCYNCTVTAGMEATAATRVDGTGGERERRA